MKKLSFSFLCKENPGQMPASGHTRHCAKCARNIVDFTGMRPEEIARHLKTAAKPCGFMLPWQLDETNVYLQEQGRKGIPLRRLVKIAAVVSAPLVLQQARAQTVFHSDQVAQNDGKNNPMTEVLLRSVSGAVLAGIMIDVANENGEVMAQLKTDELGKIYLDHQWANSGKIVLKNEALGLVKTIQVGGTSACVIWNTKIEAQAVKKEIPAMPAYAFRFKIWKDSELSLLSSDKMDITLYDSLNNIVGELKAKTDRKGELKLADKDLVKVSYVMFNVHTKEGVKTAYATLSLMELRQTNELVIEDYERMKMGIMVDY